MVSLHLSGSGALDPHFSCGAPDHYAITQVPYLHLLQKLIFFSHSNTNFLGAIENYSLHLKGTYAHD